MADGHAAHDPDRLPWLADTRIRRRSGDSASLLAWVVAATLLVAGVSYWLGMKSVTQPEPVDLAGRSPPAATVRLPEPAVVPPRVREVPPSSAPVVEPVKPAPVAIPKPEPVRSPAAGASRRSAAKAKAAASRKARARPAPAKKAVKKKAAPPRPARLRAWPASQSAGAQGRLVRIGTFASRRQAKQGWARIVRVYPGMGRLRAVVVPSRSLRNGRTFYRLQFGTTSQAHSEVLCQRMRIVAQSCVTVGLPASGGKVRR